jgi:hypothetical protein
MKQGFRNMIGPQQAKIITMPTRVVGDCLARVVKHPSPTGNGMPPLVYDPVRGRLTGYFLFVVNDAMQPDDPDQPKSREKA